MKDEEVQKAVRQAFEAMSAFKKNNCYDEKAVASLAGSILIAQAIKENNCPPDGL